MTLESRISQDLKEAMLSGQKSRVLMLRGLKSTLLYAKVAEKLPRDEELGDDKVMVLLLKEAKKRQESADLYLQGGDHARADAELSEKEMIEAYLPAQATPEEVDAAVDAAIGKLGAQSPRQMGEVIAEVRETLGGAADGATIARIVKEKLH